LTKINSSSHIEACSKSNNITYHYIPWIPS
jgi:hypothetical protein